jgi:hypothetical protein
MTTRRDVLTATGGAIAKKNLPNGLTGGAKRFESSVHYSAISTTACPRKFET